MREYDLRLNGGRTHIVESYAFELDLLMDVPLDLAPSEAFALDGTLRELVRSWQRDVPMRALKGPAWRRPGTFYVQCRHGGLKLAKVQSRDRVLQIRAYMQAIFSEAVDQDYLPKDPPRKVKVPAHLRETDKTVLTWDQLRLALMELTLQDRILLELVMTQCSSTK